ncbi:MAG: radical SAM protein [Deltaproteobacteria bacterium]
MEPDRQIEIQLGHMCNNRCVFCVSGQRTAMREAFPMPAAPVLERLRSARAEGIHKVTLLGGEPTLQPEFMDVVREAVALGFDEVVLFTNGVKTARAEFVDEILATGGRFTWRLSFQGATARSHDRTTGKPGSFRRLVQTLEHLRARGQRITVNMCVVRSNFESVAEFPALLAPFGVVQLHLDMIRPRDAGVRSEDEMRGMLPRYSDMTPFLERMLAGLPEGFDANLGNLPYCVAPSLAPWIHHDGEATLTVSVDQKDTLSEAWDKYEVKRQDKLKPASCRACLFDGECSGVFETYRDYYGVEELVPVTPERLRAADPSQRLFALHMRPHLATLDDWEPPAPFARPIVHVDSRAHEITLSFRGDKGAHARVSLRRPGGGGGVAATDRFAMHLLEAHDAGPQTVRLLRALLDRLCDGDRARVVHPVADDAGFQSARRFPGNRVDPKIGRCLTRLRARAPFGVLAWRDVQLADDGREAAVSLVDPDGMGVTVRFAVKGAQVAGGYRLDRAVASPSAALVESVRAVMDALRAS